MLSNRFRVFNSRARQTKIAAGQAIAIEHSSNHNRSKAAVDVFAAAAHNKPRADFLRRKEKSDTVQPERT